MVEVTRDVHGETLLLVQRCSFRMLWKHGRGLSRICDTGFVGFKSFGVMTFFRPAMVVTVDPVDQRVFKADVVTRFFGFDPLVTEDFFPFGGVYTN